MREKGSEEGVEREKTLTKTNSKWGINKDKGRWAKIKEKKKVKRRWLRLRRLEGGEMHWKQAMSERIRMRCRYGMLWNQVMKSERCESGTGT